MIIEKQKVLDNGFVRYIDHMGSDLTVVNSARVSFNKESSWEYESQEDIPCLSDKDKKLVSYLARHGHWTPFAHPQVTLHIKAPFPIRTQFFKHKVGFVENEISRRYVDSDPEYFYPEWCARPEKMKQGAGDPVEVDISNKSYLIYSQAIDACDYAYKTLLNIGVAPEQCRMILPLGTYTEWYWTGSLASYARFFKQRSSEHAQQEIREYANAIGKIISELFPVSWGALNCQSISEIE
jgi:thymidylate synthase (FAD)